MYDGLRYMGDGKTCVNGCSGHGGNTGLQSAGLQSEGSRVEFGVGGSQHDAKQP